MIGLASIWRVSAFVNSSQSQIGEYLMRRSFLAATALVAILAFAATTASAQTTFFSEDFSTASGLNSPNWSVTLTDLGGSTTVLPTSIGPWRFDNPQPIFGGVLAPIVTPFASADSDGAGGGSLYSTSMRSVPFNVAGSSKLSKEKTKFSY